MYRNVFAIVLSAGPNRTSSTSLTWGSPATPSIPGSTRLQWEERTCHQVHLSDNEHLETKFHDQSLWLYCLVLPFSIWYLSVYVLLSSSLLRLWIEAKVVRMISVFEVHVGLLGYVVRQTLGFCSLCHLLLAGELSMILFKIVFLHFCNFSLD